MIEDAWILKTQNNLHVIDFLFPFPPFYPLKKTNQENKNALVHSKYSRRKDKREMNWEDINYNTKKMMIKYLRRLECLSQLMFQLPLVINSENTENRNANSTVRPYIL
jgi:hypothetical protein